MPQITSLLNGENINQDHQLTSLALATLHAGVISGLQVSAGSVAVGKAFVECTRSNGEKIMVLFENTSPLSVDTSGNGKIFVRIPQENIDNGSLNAEDGSNIGRIERAAAYPAANYVPLASVSGGVVTDERVMIAGKGVVRKGFGQNKTVIIDSNGEEKIVNSTTGSPADTDIFRLQTQDGNEKKVPFSTIRNAVSGNEITLTAGENITGVAPIPVISIPQGNYTLNIMPSPVNGRFQNGSMYDGAQFALVSGSWQSNKYRIPGDFIMDFGKVRKITSLHILIEALNFGVHIYHSNTNGDWISTAQESGISTSNSGNGTDWKKIEINKKCRFLRISATYSSVTLRDIRVIEEIPLHGVYAARPDNPLFSRVDGFLMAPANSGESVQLHTTEQFSTLNGFTSVSNGIIFLSGKGLMSATANHHQIGVVKHGKLLRDSVRISGNETQLSFFFMDNKFSGNQGYSAGWHYGEPRAIEYGHYKIRMEGQGAYSSGGRSTVFLQYSIDGENWLSVWSYSAHSGAANVDASLRLHAGFVRFATQYHQSVNNDGTFWIKSLTLSSLVG